MYHKKKYAKDGLLYYVPVGKMQTDLTLEVLKDLIATRLNLVMPIDVLESDRGPSIEEMAQFKRMKVIHVRPLTKSKSLPQCNHRMPATASSTAPFIERLQRDYPVVPKSSRNQPTASAASVTKSVTKSVMKRKLPPVQSVNPSKLMNLAQELPFTKSKTRNFPMKIWKFQFEDGSGVWGKADFELVKDIGEGP